MVPQNDKYTKYTNSEPGEKRAHKFFRFFDRFGDLFILSLLFCAGCIPIVTIGTSLTASYFVTNQMVRGKDGAVTKDYWRSFKANAKQTIPLWIGLLVVFYIMYVQYQYLPILTGMTQKVMMVLLILEFIVLAFMVPFLFPMIARYNNTVPKFMINSIIISLRHLGTWLKVFWLWMVPVVVYYMRPALLVYTWYLWIFIFSGIWFFATSMQLRDTFDAIEEKEAADAEQEDERKKEE